MTELIIESDRVMPRKVGGRGRKKGDGLNLRLLTKMNVNDTVWEIPKNRMQSIRASAHRGGFRIQIRRQPYNSYYVIKKLLNVPREGN